MAGVKADSLGQLSRGSRRDNSVKVDHPAFRFRHDFLRDDDDVRWPEQQAELSDAFKDQSGEGDTLVDLREAADRIDG